MDCEFREGRLAQAMTDGDGPPSGRFRRAGCAMVEPVTASLQLAVENEPLVTCVLVPYCARKE